MNTGTQATIQNFDAGLLDQLRQDADLHCVDLTRCRVAPLGDGRYVLTFDRPVADLSRFCPGAPTQLTARNVAQAEGLMLLWCKRIQVAERQAVRTGTVGLDSLQINRTPLTAEELARHRRHLEELALQRRIALELVEAVEQRQREVERADAADLASRYPGSVSNTPRKPKAQPAPFLPNAPTKRGVTK